MNESQTRQLGQSVDGAAERLWAVVHPGDESQGFREDLSDAVGVELDRAIKLLGTARDALDPSVGMPEAEQGLESLKQASEILSDIVHTAALPDVVQSAAVAAMKLTEWAADDAAS